MQNGFDWSRYAIGGATRPDSFTRLTPAMQSGLADMFTAAEAALGPGLQVYSAYRSPELQAKLYADALQKYGSEAAARKWVAPPGRSKHNSGQAVDLKWNGARLDQLPADHPTRVWLSQNVGNFGLAQPLSHEPWQIEEAGARGQLSFPAQAGVPASDTSAAHLFQPMPATGATGLNLGALLAERMTPAAQREDRPTRRDEQRRALADLIRY